MTRKKNPRTDAADGAPPAQPPGRNDELSSDQDIKDALLELYTEIQKGFDNQDERANDQMDYWEIDDCELGANQYYSGNSRIFLPIVHDAINARVTRFTNQIFPQAGRFVEVTTEDGSIPHAEMSLIEHYVRRTKLRTIVMPALLRNGDVEGQYNVYVGWSKRKRHVAWRTQKPLQPTPQAPQLEADPDGEELVDDIQEETLVDQRPTVEVLADADVLVLPYTADSVGDALANGGSATILRRWSKARIRQMIADDEIEEEAGDQLLEEFKQDRTSSLHDKAKKMVNAAGIHMSGGGKHALVYETWTELLIDGERRLCRSYFGGEKNILACRRNPNWSDKCPLFSVPVEKVQGSFKGKSKVKPCKEVQYYANDVINEAADSSMYSMMPIVMTDPERNPRIGSMVLALAAVWECDPQSTQFAKFPDIWKSGFEIVASCKQQIMQSLSVSPAAITQSGGAQKSKPSQADVAREQQVDILTTADAVTVIEEGILTPIVNFMIELDHQFRDEEILIRQFGETGLRAKMEWVPPIQMERRYTYRWFGVEQARNQMQIQQQIAMVGVITKVPPQQYEGYKLNLVPVLTQLVQNAFGPRLAPLIFQDLKEQMTLPPDLENKWLAQGVDLFVHPMDDDPQHLQAHQELMAQGDPQGIVRVHMRRHMLQMEMKQQAQLAQQVQQMGGMPGGQPPPGRAGAQQRGPRGNGQQPPGAIHRDQIGPQAGQPPQLRGAG
jgi:hypothetical protein